MSTGEAAHPAVTSMGTWCKMGKQVSNCPCLTWWCWGHCGTSGFATSLHETWIVLLWVPSPAPRGFATRLKCLSGAQASQCWFTGGNSYVSHGCRRLCFACFALCVCVCVSKVYSHYSSLLSCLNGDLVTWCKLRKQPTQL